MIKPPPPKTTGIAGIAAVFCVAALAAGAGFDFLSPPDVAFNVAVQPGGRAVLGVGVAAVLVLAAHALRFALRSRAGAQTNERGDAVDHA